MNTWIDQADQRDRQIAGQTPCLPCRQTPTLQLPVTSSSTLQQTSLPACFLSLKLLPPHCAVLLVLMDLHFQLQSWKQEEPFICNWYSKIWSFVLSNCACSRMFTTPSLASPPYGSMPGPAQLEVLRLKVVLATEADVRQALRSKGFTRTRVSQLWTQCLQSPPRSSAQRELQTAQDQPNCNQSASKELNSTNDAPSIIYPDSIIDCLSR